MEITFSTEEIKSACHLRCPGSLTQGVLTELRALYLALRSAEHVDELPFGKPPPGTNALEWQVAIGDGYRVTLRVAHQHIPTAADAITWERVHRVQIVDIEGRDA